RGRRRTLAAPAKLRARHSRTRRAADTRESRAWLARARRGDAARFVSTTGCRAPARSGGTRDGARPPRGDQQATSERLTCDRGSAMVPPMDWSGCGAKPFGRLAPSALLSSRWSRDNLLTPEPARLYDGTVSARVGVADVDELVGQLTAS